MVIFGEAVPRVNDPDTAREFLAWCCRHLGLGFHPDTDFETYVNADGGQVFGLFEGVELEAELSECFQHLDDVYAECLKLPPFCDQVDELDPSKSRRLIPNPWYTGPREHQE